MSITSELRVLKLIKILFGDITHSSCLIDISLGGLLNESRKDGEKLRESYDAV